jgi:hypothetical protein
MYDRMIVNAVSEDVLIDKQYILYIYIRIVAVNVNIHRSRGIRHNLLLSLLYCYSRIYYIILI